MIRKFEDMKITKAQDFKGGKGCGARLKGCVIMKKFTFISTHTPHAGRDFTHSRFLP